MKKITMKLFILLLSISTAISLQAGEFTLEDAVVMQNNFLPNFNDILEYFKTKDVEVEKQVEEITIEDPSEYAVQPRTSRDYEILKKITPYLTFRNVGYFVISCGGVYTGYRLWVGYKQWLLTDEINTLSEKIGAQEETNKSLQEAINRLAVQVTDNSQKSAQLFQKTGAAQGLMATFNTTFGPVQAAFMAFPGQIKATQKLLTDTGGMLESARLVLEPQTAQFAGPVEEMGKLAKTLENKKKIEMEKVSLLTTTIDGNTQDLETLLKILQGLEGTEEEIKARFANISNIAVDGSQEQREFIAAVTHEVLRQLALK